MAIFPRPVSPKTAANDLWGYFRESRPHKWPLLGLSAAITWVIIWAFIVDGRTNTAPTRHKIIYVKSWNADRSDADVILQQKLDIAKGEIALKSKQNDMQKIADIFGIEWREEAARNAARRKEALKSINAQLDARLARAEAQAKDAGGAAPAPAPATKP